MSQAVIVVNHRAGAGVEQVEPLADQLVERLRDQGRRVREPIALQSDGDEPAAWTHRLQQALADDCDRVFVLGGDGTVLAVAAQLLERKIPLGIIPLGTANLLARDLGIPLQPHEAIERLTDAAVTREADIDVGFVNDQPFLCASMIGLTNALARTREAVRGSGLLRVAARMARATARLLARYPYRRLRITADDQQLKVKTRAIMITNNPIRSVVRPYPSRERLDTGQLGLYGVCQGPLWELPRLGLRLLQGDWADDPRIFFQHSASLLIETRHQHRMTVMNDGERLRLKTPLAYQIRPAALRVLRPREDAQPVSSTSDRA